MSTCSIWPVMTQANVEKQGKESIPCFRILHGIVATFGAPFNVKPNFVGHVKRKTRSEGISMPLISNGEH